MKILIISRKKEEKRRQFQSWQMQKLGLDFAFLDAFEANELSDEECQKAANTWPSPTLREDIACFTSHRIAYQNVIDSNQKTLILEDDAVLSSDIASVLDAIDARRDDWDVMYDLETTPQSYILAKSASWIDNRGFKATRVFQNRIGTAGYVIGPDTAKKMLEDTERYGLLDAYIWHRPWLKAYQIEPAPVIQMRFLGDNADNAAFVRSTIAAAFRPQSKLRKRLMRFELESIKARNLIRGFFAGETRELRMEPEKFELDAAHTQ